MSVSSSAQAYDVCSDSGPDFLEFLGEELNVPAHEVTALLGRWLVEYRPREPREIQVLRPRAGQPQPFAMESSP
ncbi:MAG TPA: hypothetical protein VG937_04600 [Polyangiaceae bacterium]|jgi:hypothetical protein|nr:hypothetical protein [Polyangiaceae bacterium]